MPSRVATRISWFVATVAGIGYAPWASGTVASIVAAGCWYWLWPETWVQWSVIGCVGVVGTWAAHVEARRTADDDPHSVVIDECLGMWLSLVGLPKHLAVVAVAFFLFRLLDIIKCPPMRQLERLPGGFGIMADDIAAGLIARAVLVVGSLTGFVR